MNLAMKSTKAWALIVVLGRYSMSNLLSSIANKTNCPTASELFIAFPNGLSIWTTMVCAWKYDLRFRATVTKAKANFSVGGIFLLPPKH